MSFITGISFSRFKGSKNIEKSFCPASIAFVGGEHGGGKTTLLEAVAFAGAMFKGRLSTSLFDLPLLRDLISANCTMEVKAFVGGHNIAWRAKFSQKNTKDADIRNFHPDSEILAIDGKNVFSVSNDNIRYGKEKKKALFCKYDGSVFAGLLFEKIIPANDENYQIIKDFINFMRGIHYSGILTPEIIVHAGESEAVPQNIGFNGRDAITFFHSLPKAAKETVNEGLRQLFPWFQSIKTIERADVIDTSISAVQDGKTIKMCEDWMPASFWRYFAILTELESAVTVALFDEIETVWCNTLWKQIMKRANETGKQIFVASAFFTGE